MAIPTRQQRQSAWPPERLKEQAARLLDELAAKQAPELEQLVFRQARRGNLKAACYILSHVWPHQNGRPVRFRMPELRTAADVVNALAQISRQVAEGELTIEEGALLGQLIEASRKAIETTTLAADVAEIKRKLNLT